MDDRRDIPRNVIVLGLVSLFTDVSSEMIYPLIPVFVAALGSGAIVLGVIEGVAETTASVLKLFSGIISDRIGKRKLLVVIGYSLSSLIRPFTGVVAAAWQIVFIRMFDRVGKGIRTAPRDALIASSVDQRIRGKAFGFHRAMDHAGAVLGPLVAVITLVLLVSYLHIRDTLVALRWTFILAVIPGVLAVATALFFVKEMTDAGTTESAFRFSLKRFDGNFLRYLFVVVLFTLGNSSDAFLLFRVEEAISKSGALYLLIADIPFLGDVAKTFGDLQTRTRLVDILFLPLIWAFFHIIKVVFSTPLGSLSDRVGRKIVINIGWGIYALVYFGFALLDRLPGSWQIGGTFVLFAIYALYYAFSEGAEKAFVADVAGPELRGSAFGMYNFAVGLGALPASIIFGFLYGAFGAPAAFGTGAAIACISILLLAVLVRERSTKATA